MATGRKRPASQPKRRARTNAPVRALTKQILPESPAVNSVPFGDTAMPSGL